MIAVAVMNYLVAVFCLYQGLKYKDLGQHGWAITFGGLLFANIFVGTMNLLNFLK